MAIRKHKHKAVVLLLLFAFVFAVSILRYHLTKECEITLVVVTDNNFTSISNNDINEIITATVKALKKKFNLNVHIFEKEAMTYDVFSASGNVPDSFIDPLSFDILNEDDTRDKFLTNVLNTYPQRYNLIQIKNFFSQLFLPNEDISANSVIDTFIRSYLERLTKLKSAKLESDELLLDPETYRKSLYSNWKRLVERSKYDVVLTNMFIIDDYIDMPPHVMVRGGVLPGFIVDNETKYKRTAVVSTFPFLSQSDYFKSERDYVYSNEINDMIAYYMCHELGHVILKLKDIYADQNSIMDPAVGLKIHKWYKNVSLTGDDALSHDAIE